jgi:hypothetical protein
VNVGILNNRSEHCAIAHALVTTEREDIMEIVYKLIYELEPEACANVQAKTINTRLLFSNPVTI